MGLHGQSLNNDIIVKAIIEVGKFVGVEDFNEENARKFIDCFVAVMGKYLKQNKDRIFHLNKYIISKDNRSKYNLFSVHIFRQDSEIRTPDDMYDYYIKGGLSTKKFLSTIKGYIEQLVEQPYIEDKKSHIIEKLNRAKKKTKRQYAKKLKNKRKK